MVICDTNIISKYLERVPKVVENIETIGIENIAITPVILIELNKWLSVFKGIDKPTRQKYKKKFDTLKMLHLNKGISELSIDISKKDNSLDPADILIGATGVYYDLPVYTHNLKHFKLIKGITLYNEK
ncbi:MULTISPECIES: type II toxin-antitoxin system VapC family toxin [Capnocytophaga]|jgi:putative PIN domain protein|uniref:PIN domain-containing protein n=1 Tax=Capnocytophaga genosp. AHN8471 TaxID=327574 RepID=A0ABS1YX69_9FLAO|nr:MULTISPECIES: PIN domain-containing protein [Capnocytophaga]MBM0651014.1 PIN domain-containing protein [Capnocytophaga genosp. AHN8471]MBM0661604.1 PIN domain-containing protein [Capnocytophaga genosp. AHN8471]